MIYQCQAGDCPEMIANSVVTSPNALPDDRLLLCEEHTQFVIDVFEDICFIDEMVS